MFRDVCSTRYFICLFFFLFPTGGTLPPEAMIGSSINNCNPVTDLSLSCQFKHAECRLISIILHGIDGGLSSNLLFCAKEFNIDLTADSSSNEDWVDSPVSSLKIVEDFVSTEGDRTLLRWCMLNRSHLLKPDGKLDRDSIAQRFENLLLWYPTVSSDLSDAAYYCPEPEDYDMRPFFHCLRNACLSSAPDVLEMFISVDTDLGVMVPWNATGVATLPPFVAGGLAY